MKKPLLLLAAVVGSTSLCLAQRLSPTVLASAGGSHQTATLSLDWTLGEVAVETVTPAGQGRIYTQGFHQPVLRVEVQAELGGSPYRIGVAPNPVTSTLNVSIDAPTEGEPLQLSLTNLQGKPLYSGQAPARQDTRQIDMAGLPSGLYLLQVRSSSDRLIKSFKIIKN